MYVIIIFFKMNHDPSGKNLITWVNPKCEKEKEKREMIKVNKSRVDQPKLER